MSSVTLFGCSNSTPSDEYALGYKKNSNGYYITATRHGHTVSTFEGSIGVRFDKNEFRADDPIYSNYNSVEKVDNGLLARGTISSKWGTTIAFTDHFSIANDRILVNREFIVENAGEDYGFMVEQKWTDLGKGELQDKEWFVPSTYYVTGKHGFDQASTRLYFDGKSLTIPADDVSVLVASSLYEGFSFALLDTTPGYRETAVEDRYTADSSYLYIDEDFNFAGINLCNTEEGKTSISHIYPSYTKRTDEKFIYRLLPVEEGLTRQISFQIFLENYDDYNDMYQSTWKNAYSFYKYVDKRYSLNDVHTVLRNYVKNSYSETSIWGNIPQYMSNADHYFPDSGFLYRNLEMALFMLIYGSETGDQTTINNAVNVINYQINNDTIDMKMKAYTRDNSVFKRVLFDGLASAVDLYYYLVKMNSTNNELLTKLHDYIYRKAELYKNDESLLGISFYSRLAKYQDVLFLDYKDVAIRQANAIMKQTKDYAGYYGAVENKDLLISVAEDYYLFLRGMMNVYEATQNHAYLKECERLAHYLQTYSVIQPINLNPVGTTGAEGFFSGFIGNERFLAYGYSYNNTDHCILDCPTTSSTIELYKLAKYTGDSIYLDYLETKLYNALLYVNMGDKVGYMDDPLHSSGEGFINEFAGNSTIKENFPEAGIRGAVHDSVIGWNIYEILYAFEGLKSAGYEGFDNDATLTHNIAKHRVIEIEEDNIAHTVNNVVNGLDETYYVSNKDTEFVIDLNEHSLVENISVTADTNINISLSQDGVNYTPVIDLTNVNQKAHFVKCEVTKDNKVYDVTVNGYPVKYENLAVNATIVNNAGSMSSAIDKSNYMTSWNAGSNTQAHILILDLHEVKDIYQTAIMFSKTTKYSYTIEVSVDGNTYVPYATEDGSVDKYVFVNQVYTTARFVKLTVSGSTENTILVKDFKVMGSTK